MTRALTPLRATSLMVGAGVGAGIMAVPFLAERVGLPGLLLILVVAYGAATFIHLMLVEILLRTGRPLQVIELMRLWVLDRPGRRWLLWLIFGLLTVAFVAALAAYVAADAEILSAATGLPPELTRLFVYAPIAVEGSPTDALALYGMVMYGYYAFFSVPQVVKGLAPDGRAAARSVAAGLAVNGVLIGTVAVIALGVSEEVTEVAISGISDQLGPWSGGIGAIFVFAALLTTYWAVSLALADIIAERIGIGFRSSWLIATLPSLLLLYLGVMGFLDWLQLAAGLTAIVIALVTVPMYLNARRRGAVAEPDWSLGRWGGRGMLGLALLATVLMAVGSLIEA